MSKPATSAWTKLDAPRRIKRARTQMLVKQPFWGELSMRLRVREASDVETLVKALAGSPIVTAATNGVDFIYQPTTIAELDEAEVIWVVAHEVCHCALGHPWRCGPRDPQLWNVAADAAANYVLLQSGFKMPPNRIQPIPGLEGASVERIYAYLKQQQADGGSGKPAGELSDDHRLWTNAGQSEQLQTTWKAAVAAAALGARARGQLPAGLDRLVAQFTAPQLDWRQILARFMLSLQEDDLTWNRVRKVAVVGTRGAYWPRTQSEGIRVAVGLDTSGSISKVQIQAFLGELTGILWSIGGLDLTIYICDAAVHAVWHLTPQDPIPDKIPGGGGTDFRPVFQRVEQDYDTPPDALVFFTDSDGTFPAEAPDYPVLWIVDGPPKLQATVPWGEVVEYTAVDEDEDVA